MRRWPQAGNCFNSGIINFLITSLNAMATYLELKQKAEKLMAEAEQMRQKEIDDVIAEIREKMKAYGLTAKDIGGSGAGRKRSSGAAAKTVKYRGPNGETWSGGRGRKPRWVTEALAKGKKIEDFAV
jgi:DNA-binding protein H-NS